MSFVNKNLHISEKSSTFAPSNKIKRAATYKRHKTMKTINAETLKQLIENYDNAKAHAKAQYEASEKIMNAIWNEEASEAENEANINKALFQAGLTDENGCTDLYEKERIAKNELLDYIFCMVPKAQREVFEANRQNVTQMNKVIELARKFAA